MMVGEKLYFGKYQWRILEVYDDRLLIMTEDIIEKMPYHHTYTDVTWETSDMRKYLNGIFYQSFSTEERAHIIKVKNQNVDNPWYHTKGGNDTEDDIFLLDIYDVVCKYFGDSSAKLVRKSEKERYWFGKRDQNNVKRLAQYQGHNYWWWTRTPGRLLNTAVYIHGLPIGCVGINGNNVFFASYSKERNGGIRPVLWLKKTFVEKNNIDCKKV